MGAVKRAVLILGLLLFASPARAAISFVNIGKGGGFKCGTPCTTGGQSVTAGNQMVVTVGFDATNKSVSSVTDTVGSTYTKQAAINNGTTNREEVWATANILSTNASDVVTVNYTGSGATPEEDIVAGQYSGAAALGHTCTNTGSGTSVTCTLITQDSNNFLAMGLMIASATTTLSGGTGTTLRDSKAGSTSTDGVADATLASPGSLTATVNSTVSAAWSAAGVELRTSSGGGAACKPTLTLLGVGRCG